VEGTGIGGAMTGDDTVPPGSGGRSPRKVHRTLPEQEMELPLLMGTLPDLQLQTEGGDLQRAGEGRGSPFLSRCAWRRSRLHRAGGFAARVSPRRGGRYPDLDDEDSGAKEGEEGDERPYPPPPMPSLHGSLSRGTVGPGRPTAERFSAPGLAFPVIVLYITVHSC
jgi:hypothetical protein